MDYTIVNPFIGHGIAFVSGEDEKKTQALVDAISDALPHVAPANRGFTNGEPDGDVVATKGGITVTLFSTATDEEVAAVKKAVA